MNGVYWNIRLCGLATVLQNMAEYYEWCLLEHKAVWSGNSTAEHGRIL
jgi:hypothetical protein